MIQQQSRSRLLGEALQPFAMLDAAASRPSIKYNVVDSARAGTAFDQCKTKAVAVSTISAKYNAVDSADAKQVAVDGASAKLDTVDCAHAKQIAADSAPAKLNAVDSRTAKHSADPHDICQAQ